MVDRTTKLLLFGIAVGLWGLLLRPAFVPIASHAQAPQEPERIVEAMKVIQGPDGKVLGVYVAAEGSIFRFSPDLGRPVAHALYGTDFGKRC